MRLAGQKLRAGQPAHIGDAVRTRLRLDSVQTRQILIAPRDDHRAGLQQGQVQSLVDREVLVVPGPHASKLEAAGRGVEAGVEQRAVALAGTGQQICGLLQHDHLGALQREPACDRAADHAGANHRDIEWLPIAIVASLSQRLPVRSTEVTEQ